MIPQLREQDTIEFITKLRAAGESFQNIATLLLDDKGIKISAVGLNKAYQRIINSNLNAVKTDLDVKSNLRTEVLDTATQLQKANKKLWAMLDKIDDGEEGRTKDAIMILSEIRKQLEFQGKLLGKITTPDTLIQMNFVDQSVKIASILSDLEAQGFIKILKKPDIINL